jgi:predicted dehydrogenase
MKKIKWGIIGPGNIAYDFAKDLSFIEQPNVVHAVLGHRQNTIKAFANQFNVPQAYTNIDDFVKKSKINIAYVATPHTFHYEQVLACLENKIPVLCEKPLTINAHQCQQLIAAAKKNKTFLMEGMWIRFLPSIVKVLEVLKTGKLGKIVSLKGAMCYNAPPGADSRYFEPALGGGSLLDLGIYPAFMSLLLLGVPDKIYAGGKVNKDGIDETCAALFHYKNGSHALWESSLISGTDLPFEIACEKGSITIANPWFEKAKEIIVSIEGKEKTIYPLQWEGHGLHFETKEVLKCVQQKRIASPFFSHTFSLQLIRILDEIRNQLHVVYDEFE